MTALDGDQMVSFIELCFTSVSNSSSQLINAAIVRYLAK